MTRFLKSCATILVVAFAIAAPSNSERVSAAPLADVSAVANLTGTPIGKMLKKWRYQLGKAASLYPDERFLSPSLKSLKAHAEEVGASRGFRVVLIEMLHPRQDAPLIVTRWPVGTGNSHNLGWWPALIGGREQDLIRTVDFGWRIDDYEGYFVVAEDSQGTPFYTRSVAGRGTLFARQNASKLQINPGTIGYGKYDQVTEWFANPPDETKGS